MKPNELRYGHVIDAGRFGRPIVMETLTDPRVWVEVDVEFERQPDMRTWDMDQFRDAVGAAGVRWLSTTPTSRYRLYYPPDAEVPVRHG